MDNKEYIYVLDYSDGTICEIVTDVNDEREVEDVLEEYGCNINTCSWMISDHKITEIIPLNID
ncbi:MAG: hypothetical protein ACI4VC_05325 [Clostridia bacterium]